MKAKRGERALLGRHGWLNAYILIHDHGRDLFFRRVVDHKEKEQPAVFFEENELAFVARMARLAKRVTEET